MSKIIVKRGMEIEISKDGLTLSLDTKAPGTDLTYAPQDMRTRWNHEGWGHYTVSRNDRNWGEAGKVAHNGAFMPLVRLQKIVDSFMRTEEEWAEMLRKFEESARGS